MIYQKNMRRKQMNNKHNILPIIKEEAEKFFTAVKDKNAASSIERKQQKELDILMSQNFEDGVTFEHSFNYNDGKVTVEINYEQKKQDKIDVRKLYENTDLETFLATVTASRSKVEETCGKNIANLCVVSRLSDWKTYVKEKK